MSVYTDLLADPLAERAFYAILEPLNPATSTVATLYFSSHGLTTRPTDTPANTHMSARLRTAFTFKRNLFSEGRLSGRTVPGSGEIVLANADGGLDYLATYAWGGRRIRVYMGGPEFNVGQYGLIFDGTAQGLSWSDEEITVNLRSLEYKLEKQIQTISFAGTGGIEGPATMEGKLKPRGYGFLQLVEPVYIGLVAGKHTFSVGDSGGVVNILGVWDRGIGLAFNNAAPIAGEYGYDQLTGTITLGGSFEGPITVNLVGKSVWSSTSTSSVTVAAGGGVNSRVFAITDAQNWRVGMGLIAFFSRNNWMTGRVTALSAASGAANLTMLVATSRGTITTTGWVLHSYGTPAQLLKKVAQDLGVTVFDEPAFVALENSYGTLHREMSYWIPEGATGLEVMDEIADGTANYWGYNRAGAFTVGKFSTEDSATALPFASTLPTLNYGSREILEIQRESTEEPVWSVTMRYKRLWRPQSTNELAATVTDKDRFIEEYQNTKLENTTTLANYPLARSLSLDTLYFGGDTSGAAVNAAFVERNRQRDLFGVRRDYFTVTLKTQPFEAELGQKVSIKHPRYGLDLGKTMWVVDIEERLDGRDNFVKLGLWG